MTLSPVRELPHDFEAEQQLLGSILANNAALSRISDYLKVEHFADQLHGDLFTCMANLIGRGQQANPFTMKSYVDSVAGLKEAGGLKYLAQIMGASVHVEDVMSYARVVRDSALRRNLIAIADQATSRAYSPDSSEPAASQIEELERRLYELANGIVEGGFSPFRHGLAQSMNSAEAAHKRQGGLSGVTTGIKSLDALLGGLHRSDLIILAGRPSMGKSALAANIGTAAAQAYRFEADPDGKPVTIDGARVGFFSLEMSAEQVVTRIVAARAGLSSERIRRGNLSSAEFDRLLGAAHEFEALPFMIDETPALTISQLRTRARRLQRQHGLDLCIVDYLQMLRVDDRRKGDNRVQDVGEITAGLKTLAKELNVPVLALSQLSRAVEQREDHRPQLSDLRESGSIEQDADVVMFVYREEYYLARKGQDVGAAKDRAEVLVEKQRHGPIGTVQMKFEAWITRFSDLGDDGAGLDL